MKWFRFFLVTGYMVLFVGIRLLPSTVAQTECTTPVNISNLLEAESINYLIDLEVSDQYVVWKGVRGVFASKTVQLYYHNLETGVTEAVSDVLPDDDFNLRFSLFHNHLVWQQPNGLANYKIYYRNLDNHDIIQLNENAFSAEKPYTDGQRVVWFGMGNDIVYYDLNTQTIHLVSQNIGYDQNNPHPYIIGDDIIWSKSDNIFKYNIPSRMLTQLTDLDSPAYTEISDIDQNDILWSTRNGDDQDVFMYDLSTDTLIQITDNSNYTDYHPKKDGSIITWIGDILSLDGVMMYNLATQETIEISDHGYYPNISDNQITWYQYDGNDMEVMLYDVSSGATAQITDNDVDDSAPVIDHHRLLWSGTDDYGEQLFYSECNPAEPTPTDTPTDSPTPTPASTDTPTPTVILTDTATAGITPTVIMTDTSTPTAPTATGVPLVELIQNGGFEAQSNGKPDLMPWTLTFKSGDKIVCDRPGTPIAHSGVCAFRFKGSSRENSTLDQNVDLNGMNFTAGDQLNLSLFVDSSNSATSGRIKLRVKYGDGTKKGKINRDIPIVKGYTELERSYDLTSAEVIGIRLSIHNTSRNGKIYLDDISLMHSGAAALIQLPE